MKGFYYLIAFALVGCLGIAISTPFILDAAEKSVIQANFAKLEKLEEQAAILDQAEHQDKPESVEVPGAVDIVKNPF